MFYYSSDKPYSYSSAPVSNDFNLNRYIYTRKLKREIERLASTSNTPRKEITVDLSPLLVDLKPYVEITGLYNGDSPHTRLGRSAQKGASTKEIYEVLSEAIKIEETRAATLKRNVDICAKLWPDRQPAQAFIEDGWGKNLRAVIKVKSKVAGKDDDVLFETKSDSRWKAMQQLDIIVKDYAQKRAQEDLERNEDKRRDSDEFSIFEKKMAIVHTVTQALEVLDFGNKRVVRL